MSIKRKLPAVAAVPTMAGGVGTVGTRSASVATPACGQRCISIFSRPVILKRASSSDPSEDLYPTDEPTPQIRVRHLSSSARSTPCRTDSSGALASAS